MPKADLDPVSIRLNAVLRLVIEYLKEERGMNVGDLILYLESSGLKKVEIAKILGIKDTSIPAIVAHAKNKELREKLKGAK